MVTNIHEHKKDYWLRFLLAIVIFSTGEHSEHYTNLSTLNHNVRFLPCQQSGRWHNAIRVRVKPCAYRFNYSRTPQRSSKLWT